MYTATSDFTLWSTPLVLDAFPSLIVGPIQSFELVLPEGPAAQSCDN
jgi:hypothetical protein